MLSCPPLPAFLLFFLRYCPPQCQQMIEDETALVRALGELGIKLTVLAPDADVDVPGKPDAACANAGLELAAFGNQPYSCWILCSVVRAR